MESHFNNGYESSAKIAFISVVGGIIMVLFMLLFPELCRAQDKWFGNDKIAHVVCSSAGSIVFTGFYASYPNIKNPALWGCSTMFAIGLGKEFVYDPLMGGTTSYKDLSANFVGCVTTYFIISFTNKKIEKVYKKKGWI
jgi:uncharacterized protein YfiM (DUF2279 family)